jgi:hypothetical protein
VSDDPRWIDTERAVMQFGMARWTRRWPCPTATQAGLMALLHHAVAADVDGRSKSCGDIRRSWHLRPKNFIEGARQFSPAAFSLSAAPGTWVDQARYSRDGLSKDRHPI